jgi:PLP dependent protein
MDIAGNIQALKEELPSGVRLVAISKTHTPGEVQQAYDTGHKIFGENKVQELTQKRMKLPEDIEWHMVGHLQSNKVKYIASFVDTIHSIDSAKLLKVVNKEAGKNDRVIKCLLQVHIAEEDTKYGFSEEELYELLDSSIIQQCRNAPVTGLMGMATFTDDKEKIRGEFQYLSGLFNKLKTSYFSDHLTFRELSMGMSGDFRIALSEGSTLVRIGSLIFGDRT